MAKIKILHIIYKLDTGGLENGVINLINNLPAKKYQHIILSLTDIGKFKNRVQSSNVEYISLNKKPGPLIKYLPNILAIIYKIRPDVVHTRNLSAIECQIPAALLGVKLRIHSEHGRDVNDLAGDNKKNQYVRKFCKYFIHKQIPLSKELEDYLLHKIQVSPAKIKQIYNGVDTTKFIRKSTISKSKDFIFITIGRIQPVKDIPTLVYSFKKLIDYVPQPQKSKLKLWIVGDGPELNNLRSLSDELSLQRNVVFWGHCEDVNTKLSQADVFVLPSLVEGISNTILEAMATGVPVICSEVGGNPELITNNKTGLTVPAKNAQMLFEALLEFYQNDELRRELSEAAKQEIESKFSLPKMVAEYDKVYC